MNFNLFCTHQNIQTSEVFNDIFHDMFHILLDRDVSSNCEYLQNNGDGLGYLYQKGNFMTTSWREYTLMAPCARINV